MGIAPKIDVWQKNVLSFANATVLPQSTLPSFIRFVEIKGITPLSASYTHPQRVYISPDPKSVKLNKKLIKKKFHLLSNITTQTYSVNISVRYKLRFQKRSER